MRVEEQAIKVAQALARVWGFAGPDDEPEVLDFHVSEAVALVQMLHAMGLELRERAEAEQDLTTPRGGFKPG